jgi:hypothetical protein
MRWLLASLTYEDEEGRFQNKLQDWWITLDERRASSLSWSGSFIQAVARLTGNCLDRLFGKRLISPRSVAVSILLSIASFFLAGSIILALSVAPIPKSPNAPSATSAFVLFLRFLAFAIIPAVSESPHLPWKTWLPRLLRLYWWALLACWTLQAAPFLIYLLAFSPHGKVTGAQLLSILALCLGISLLSDVSYIAFTRWVLRRISKIDRIGQILLAMVLQILFLSALMVLPVYVGSKLITFSSVLGLSMFLAIVLNLIDAFAAASAFIVAALMLIHRLMWPVLQRPIYAIQRMSNVNRKGWIWSVGIALLTFAFMGFPEWMKALFARLGR